MMSGITWTKVSPPPRVSFSEFMFRVLEERGTRTSVVDTRTRRCYTFHEIVDLSRRVASGLLRRGLKVGDVVCMCTRNCAEAILTILGTSAAGGVLAPANPFAASDELKQQLTQSGATFVIVEQDQASKMRRVIEQLEDNKIQEVFIIGEESGNNSFRCLMEDDGSCYNGPPAIGDPSHAPHMIFFSSGTTGLPKAIVRTHYNMVATMTMYSSYDKFPIGSDDVILCVLPLFYLLGLQMALAGMVIGTTVVIMAQYGFVRLCEEIDRYKVTFLPAVPTILENLNQMATPDGCSLQSLKFVLTAGDMLKRATAFQIIDKFHLQCLFNDYGSSETGPIALTTICDEKITVGPPVPSVEFKVINVDSGELLGPFERGELCVKSPMVMKGYLKGTLESGNVLTQDGFFKTGDVAYFDEDRNIFLVDRKKNFIKYKGHQVSPSELENILVTHEWVNSAAVVGIPDEEAGALPRAYITLRPGCNSLFSEKEIMKFVADRVAPHKQLRGGVVVVSEIPKSTNGKISRKTLQEMVCSNRTEPAQQGS